MGILRADRITGLGGANAIKGSTRFSTNRILEVHGAESNEDFRLSNGSFTIEFWAYVADTSNSTFVGLFENSPARRSYQFEIRSSQALRFEWWTDGSSGTALTASTGSFIRDRWHHFAVVRNGTAINIYVDGTSVANTTTSDTLYENTIEPLTIGGIFQSGALTQDITGFISNLRIIKGEAIYTANFTPPTSELTITSNTVVLACQSPGNVLQEATGKTVVATTTSTNDAPPEASHFTPNSPVGFSTTTDVGTQFGSTFGGVTTFDSQAYMVVPGGNTRERNRGRGIFGDADQSNDIEFIEIQSMGNSQEFGDSTTIYKQRGSVASSIRAVTAGGFDSPAFTNIIDFITIANTGNATDFGDLLTAKRNVGGAGNNTRGIYLGGANPGATNTIEFITIATAGNAQDFADATAAKSGVGALASPTRACFGGGQDNTIEFVTIASQGTNASDFGDLISGTTEKPAGTSSSTRGLFICGESQPSGTRINTIQFITIASTGNATDFGDHTDSRRSFGACNNSTRAVYGGGNTSSGSDNALSFVTIATTGNGQDFGDLLSARSTAGTASSDSHGGIE